MHFKLSIQSVFIRKKGRQTIACRSIDHNIQYSF